MVDSFAFFAWDASDTTCDFANVYDCNNDGVSQMSLSPISRQSTGSEDLSVLLSLEDHPPACLIPPIDAKEDSNVLGKHTRTVSMKDVESCNDNKTREPTEERPARRPRRARSEEAPAPKRSLPSSSSARWPSAYVGLTPVPDDVMQDVFGIPEAYLEQTGLSADRARDRIRYLAQFIFWCYKGECSPLTPINPHSGLGGTFTSQDMRHYKLVKDSFCTHADLRMYSTPIRMAIAVMLDLCCAENTDNPGERVFGLLDSKTGVLHLLSDSQLRVVCTMRTQLADFRRARADNVIATMNLNVPHGEIIRGVCTCNASMLACVCVLASGEARNATPYWSPVFPMVRTIPQCPRHKEYYLNHRVFVATRNTTPLIHTEMEGMSALFQLSQGIDDRKVYQFGDAHCGHRNGNTAN